MKLNPKPATQVRMVTMREGKYLFLDDMKVRLKDDRVIDEALTMLKIGHDKGDDVREVMRRALGSFVAGCAGEHPKKSSSSYSDETRTDSSGPDSPGVET